MVYEEPSKTIWVRLGPIGVPVPLMPCIQTIERNELLGTYWIRFDLLADNTPPGRMASTSFPCAKRLLFVVA